MEENKDSKAHEAPGGREPRLWHFCEICGMVRIAASCFLVVSRFADDDGHDNFILAKQFLCLDKNGKFVVKYSKNAVNFYSLRSLREAAEMLLSVAEKFGG